MPSTRVLIVLGVLAVLAGAGFAAWQWSERAGAPFSVTGTTNSQGTADVGGPFTLTDQDGTVRHDADFRGQYMLVYFGYTYCPDVCPTSLFNMSQALDILAEQRPEAAEEVTPIFITVDPERDTVEVLADYAAHFHPNLVALTGTPQQIAEVAKAYRVYYAKVENDSGDDYLMDHASFIFLMDPDGGYVTHYNHQTAPEKMAASLERHIAP